MSLFRVNASILGPHSSSRALADVVQQRWHATRPDARIVERDLGASPIPATFWGAAVSARRLPREQWTPEQAAAQALAAEILAELRAADVLIVATGLYNWGVNQLLKAWLDLAFVVAPQGEKVLAGKEVVLVVTRGGYYGDDGPRAGWDHGTPWLVRVFSEVWGAKVTLLERDFTLVGVNPALDAFRERGAALKERAFEEAERVGEALGA